MDTITQQNDAMVQESTTAAANMRRHAEHLNQLINSFVLGEDEPQHQALASPAPQQRGSDSGMKRPALSSNASSQPSSKPSPAKHAADEWEEF